MKILAVDSVSKTIKVKLLIDNEIYTKNLDGAKNASEYLLVMIDEILTNNNLSLKDVDYLALNIGPGSFTGIRIAMSLFKGFMVSLPIKCVAVNSFDLLSYNIKEDKFAMVLDSGTSDYYVMIKENALTTFVSHNINEILNLSKEFTIYSQVELENVNFKLLAEEENALIECAKLEIENKNFKSSFELEPLYVKKAQSEREYKQKFLSSLQISKAKTEDLKEIFNLEKENFTHDVYNENQILEDINLGAMLCAKQDNKIIGYLSFRLSDSAEILKIAVDKNNRNLGVGESLINELENLSQRDIFLEVSEKNKAKNFYAKLGFKLISVRKKYYQDGSDALIMMKKY